MTEYSRILAEIDRHKAIGSLADQQRMLIEDEIHSISVKLRHLDQETERRREELYTKMLDPQPLKPLSHTAQIKRHTHTSDNSSEMQGSSVHQLIKDSIKTLPGFTEYVRNSEFMDAFRESYAKDIQNHYSKQNKSVFGREGQGSLVESENLELSAGKERFNMLYNSYKHTKESSRKREDHRLPNHNNTIKEDAREYEEEPTYLARDYKDKIEGSVSKSSESNYQTDRELFEAGLKKKTSRTGSRQEKKKETTSHEKEHTGLGTLRPDIKESLPEDYYQGNLQIPSDAHLNFQKQSANSSEFNKLKLDISQKSPLGEKARSNRWNTDREVRKSTNKTTSMREEEVATNFGKNDSDSEDKSGLVSETPQKPKQRTTLTSDQSNPIKTTSKKEEVLTFRKRESASKLKQTHDGTSEIMEFESHKASFFDKDPHYYEHSGGGGSNAKTNTFQEISSRRFDDYGGLVKEGDEDYIYEEDYEDDSQNKLPVFSDRDKRLVYSKDEQPSLDYSDQRRRVVVENIYEEADKVSKTSKPTFDLSRKEGFKEITNFHAAMDRRDTKSFATNLTPLPSANHFDNPGDKTLNIQGIVNSDIEKNFGFGAEEMSLIKKPSNKSGSGGTLKTLQAALIDERTGQKTDSYDISPDLTPVEIRDKVSPGSDPFKKEEPYGARNKEMINRFDTFFRKMAIEENNKWDENNDLDDTRMRFFKDSALGYEDYLEAIGGPSKKTTTVIDSSEKKVPIGHQQSHSKVNDKGDSKIHQSRSISYLTDMPSKIQGDSQGIGLRIETGGAQIRETINSIKQRDTEFDSARVTSEQLVYLAQSEIPGGEFEFGKKGSEKRKDKSSSSISHSVYPKSIQESHMKSRNTYNVSKNFNYQVNELIEDYEEDEFEDDWKLNNLDQAKVEEDYEEAEEEIKIDRINRNISDGTFHINRNRFSKESQSAYQPSEEIDEVYIDEKQITPASNFKLPNNESYATRRTQSGRSNNHEPSGSQMEEEEISLSMGTKNPGQIFKNKLGQKIPANNRYS